VRAFVERLVNSSSAARKSNASTRIDFKSMGRLSRSLEGTYIFTLRSRWRSLGCFAPIVRPILFIGIYCTRCATAYEHPSVSLLAAFRRTEAARILDVDRLLMPTIRLSPQAIGDGISGPTVGQLLR